MPNNKPHGKVRRRRKRQAAYVFRHRCAYCRRQFDSLEEATLDHIVPRSIWPTWSATALALACWDCNHRKTNRFPLLLALLLAARYPVHDRPAAFMDDRSTVHGEPTRPARNAPTVHGSQPTVHGSGGVFTAAPQAFMPPLTLATWRLLARLAHAQGSTPDQRRQPREHPTGHAADHPESTPTEGVAA
ncbi:HNH endonuclease [Streptomyces murinus]|uniref:HNH endonuclease n=1 Tax=Streptomyces murinus TaxID=33900 RepID=UPI00380430C2